MRQPWDFILFSVKWSQYEWDRDVQKLWQQSAFSWRDNTWNQPQGSARKCPMKRQCITWVSTRRVHMVHTGSYSPSKANLKRQHCFQCQVREVGRLCTTSAYFRQQRLWQFFSNFRTTIIFFLFSIFFFFFRQFMEMWKKGIFPWQLPRKRVFTNVLWKDNTAIILGNRFIWTGMTIIVGDKNTKTGLWCFARTQIFMKHREIQKGGKFWGEKNCKNKRHSELHGGGRGWNLGVRKGETKKQEFLSSCHEKLIFHLSSLC